MTDDAQNPAPQPEPASGDAALTRRVRGRPFPPGNRHGRGRRPGSRNSAYQALDAIAEGAAEDVLRAIIEAAKRGDTRAAVLVLERAHPPRKARTVRLDLPDTPEGMDPQTIMAAVMRAVAAGEMSLDEAAAMSGIVSNYIQAVTASDVNRRLEALEGERDG